MKTLYRSRLARWEDAVNRFVLSDERSAAEHFASSCRLKVLNAAPSSSYLEPGGAKS
jgi:hypothetical protein